MFIQLKDINYKFGWLKSRRVVEIHCIASWVMFALMICMLVLVQAVSCFKNFATNIANMGYTLYVCFDMAHHVSSLFHYFLANITDKLSLPKIHCLGHHLLHQGVKFFSSFHIACNVLLCRVFSMIRLVSFILIVSILVTIESILSVGIGYNSFISAFCVANIGLLYALD